MTDNDDIYTANIDEQRPEIAVNTILWRLGVATGMITPGDTKVILSPNAILMTTERMLRDTND